MKEIAVCIKEPNRPAYAKRIIPTLENLRKIVGGYIEVVTIFEDEVIICDEDGQLKNLKYNLSCSGWDFYGTIVVSGIDDHGEFCDDAHALAFLKMQDRLTGANLEAEL